MNPVTRRPRRFIVNSGGAHADLVNRLHRLASRCWPATPVDAANLADAVGRVLAALRDGDMIRRLEFWGHGRPGAMRVGDEEVKVESFAPGHPHGALFAQLRPWLADDAVVWFRGCSTFAGTDGKNFARGAAAFFGRRIAVWGQSRLLGFNLDWGGTVRLTAGAEPDWPDVDGSDKALKKQGGGIVGRAARLLRQAGRILSNRL
jgi:hypothetical protein